MTPATTDRRTFDAVVLGDRAGYVTVAFGFGPHRNDRGAHDHRHWYEHHYAWPDEAEQLARDVAGETACESVDVYVCPAVRFNRMRRKGDAQPPLVCWADLDDEPADPELFARLDPFIVASGQDGHRHIYVPLAEPVPLSAHATLNKALAAALGGDAKWSDESLLRLPGTSNHKTDPPAPVVVEDEAWGGTVWAPGDLAALLGLSLGDDLATRHSGDPEAGNRHLAAVPNTPAPETPPEPLPGKVRAALNQDEGDRSVAHARIVGACYDTGLTLGQAISVLGEYPPSVAKYGNKLAGEVARMWGKASDQREQPQALSALGVSGSSALAPAASTTSESGMHRGQVRMACRLVAEHGDRLRFAHGLGWHIWDGARWAPDVDGEPTRAVLATTRAALREAITLDKDERDALLADVRKVESANGVKGVLELAAAMEPVATPVAHLDADPHLFNVANGTLDLRTGELREADPADLITKVAGCAYVPEAYSARFEAFLATVLPDADVRDYLQRVCGHALLGLVREHLLPICSGVGQNGKGTFLDVVRKAFGDYGISVEPELLMEAGTRHSTEQTDLRGARFVTTSETNEGRHLAASTVKRLTGGDAIRARRMRQDTIQFQPSHTLVMMTNFKPAVSGDDPAMWRRIRVIPFDVTVPESERDDQLAEKLEADLEAVLAWLVEGYRRYLEDGLAAPEAVQLRTESYRVANDALGRFLDERTVAADYGTATAGELFSAWSAWCAHNGETAGNRVAFADAMSRHGHTSRKNHGRMIYRGLILTTEGDDNASPSD